MKTVKMNYAGTSADFDYEHNLIRDILAQSGYHVQITDDPDYLVCYFAYGDVAPFSYCGKPQVRIMVSGENYIPDFNSIDYAICPYPIQFGDRNFQLPPCVWPQDHWFSLSEKCGGGTTPSEILKNKPYFANFITSHESEFQIRGNFFKKLCEYKRVESPGSYLNNMPNGATVDWKTTSKVEFQRKCKFTLCFESTMHYGFVTEKITDAFYADTIPVYYGSPTVTDIFNRNAFINCADYPSFDAAIEQIIALDQDDDAYIRMLSEPPLVDRNYPRRLDADLGAYVRHIFDQPLEQAYRRSRVFGPKYVDDYLSRVVDSDTLTMKNLAARMAGKLRKKLFSM